ncbi:glycine reductase [Syntrophus gentianae]|uniref:Glycine reductase n=1 Tax=Syntrophus gentianae TaxID=43775 RepID=A0A1H7WNI1_9BACT|nr:glycine/sarcosine/betaine reductase component B subunit [Syntrophus gentianae]SEM23073.1 glycine reductase [Syntrophus gentianae]
MLLELGTIPVEEIAWGRKTAIDGKVLSIHREELIEKTRGDDPRIASVGADLARPGESVRILPVKDVIEPRVKVEGRGGIFPGLISGVETVGTGRTHVLAGCAVVTAGQILGFQEGLIDMSGPGARYSSFSRLLNIVLAIDVNPGLSSHQHEEAIRMAGLRAAVYLGEAGRDTRPASMSRIEWPRPSIRQGDPTDLPGVAYVCMLLSQGLLHDTYLYGRDVKTLLPTLLGPTEGMDGAIVSGNCVSACDKNTTYHHQNNPVISELFRRDGIDLRFLGTVVTNANVTLLDKVRSAEYAVKLVEMLGADGGVLSKEGFGNPDADAMMICAGLGERGIRTVLISDEFAGSDGASQSLADVTPHADAIVSVGNANQRITLPPVDKVLGDIRVAEKLAGGQSGSLSKEGGLQVELQAILGATNELGFELLSARGA